MRWFTADLHFYHEGVIRFCKRPYSNAIEMNEALIENWNKRVKSKEHVYVLGDFSWNGVQKMKLILDRLNGRKILIRGNHDLPAHKMLWAGFDEVHENIQIKLTEDIYVNLSHFPYYPTNWARISMWVKGKNYDKRYLHKRIVDRGAWLFCGHVHRTYKFKNKMINVGVDVWDQKPVPQEHLVQLIKDNPKGFK